MNENQSSQTTENVGIKTKFCKHCGEKIYTDCIICPKCGKQVEELKTSPNINTIQAGMQNNPKDKWIAVVLCLFLGNQSLLHHSQHQAMGMSFSNHHDSFHRSAVCKQS